MNLMKNKKNKQNMLKQNKLKQNNHSDGPCDHCNPSDDNPSDNNCIKKPIQTIISSSAIQNIVDKLVRIRCSSDGENYKSRTTTPNRGSMRHSCAIFIEKNQTCFKPTNNRNKSRKLFSEKKEHRKRLLLPKHSQKKWYTIPDQRKMCRIINTC